MAQVLHNGASPLLSSTSTSWTPFDRLDNVLPCSGGVGVSAFAGRSTTPLPESTSSCWQQLAVVKDGGTVQFYVDGQLTEGVPDCLSPLQCIRECWPYL